MDEARRLPRNVEALTRIVRERDLTIKAQDVTLKAKDFEIEHLRLQVAGLRRLKFGQSSERFIGDAEQLTFLGEAKAPSPPAAVMEVADEPAPVPKQPIRAALPEHLPRETVQLPSPCGCPDCGGKLRKIGTVTSEILGIVPTQLKVKRVLRDKFSCATCDTVVAPELPARPIAGSYVGSSLLAFVVSSKFCYHMRYYRLAQMLTRLGYPIDRSVLTQWAKGGYEATRSLVSALGDYVLSAGKLHADDTPFKVLQPGSGSAKKGRLWAYVRD
jgi:transposase